VRHARRRPEAARREKSQRRVELVDVADGVDARRILRHPEPSPKPWCRYRPCASRSSRGDDP
jgi:hypothetical protein